MGVHHREGVDLQDARGCVHVGTTLLGIPVRQKGARQDVQGQLLKKLRIS